MLLGNPLTSGHWLPVDIGCRMSATQVRRCIVRLTEIKAADLGDG
jgi:hypothetical protein